MAAAGNWANGELVGDRLCSVCLLSFLFQPHLVFLKYYETFKINKIHLPPPLPRQNNNSNYSNKTFCLGVI